MLGILSNLQEYPGFVELAGEIPPSRPVAVDCSSTHHWQPINRVEHYPNPAAQSIPVGNLIGRENYSLNLSGRETDVLDI